MTEDFKLVREYQGWEVECLSDIDIPQEWINLSYPNDEYPSFLFNGFQIFIAEKDNFNDVIDYVNNNYGAWIHKKG